MRASEARRGKFYLNRSLPAYSVYADCLKNTEEYGKDTITVSVGLDKMFRQNDISFQHFSSECRLANLPLYTRIYEPPHTTYRYGKWRSLFSLCFHMYIIESVNRQMQFSTEVTTCYLSPLLKRLWRHFRLIVFLYTVISPSVVAVNSKYIKYIES